LRIADATSAPRVRNPQSEIRNSTGTEMIALARKYRPKRFADLLVQQHVAAALRGAVASGRVGHGYLFAGPRGVGKTTAARILAMALNCEQRGADGEPCGTCASCSRVWTGSANLDVVELDAASNRGVDDARDLRERAMYAASAEDRSKVYIVDEAHMLTREAWNALLKVLEEPPPRVVFVFATTEPQKIAQSAAPILSRLQRFDFRRIGPQAIAARLREVVAAEGLDADDEALRLIARSADGGMRDGLSLLDQVVSFGEGRVTAARVRDVLGLIADDVYDEILRCIAERDAAAVFPLVDRVIESGGDLQELIAGAGETLRALLLVGLGGEPAGLSDARRAVIARYRSVLPPEEVVRLLAVQAEVEPQLRQTVSPRLLVELLLLRWAVMDRTVNLSAVLEALGAAAPAAPPADRTPRPPSAPPVPPPPAATPRPAVAELPPERGPLTLERLQRVWPDVIARARTAGPMLPALLAGSDVATVEGGTVVIRLGPANAGQAQGLDLKRDVLERLVGEFVDVPVRVRVGVEAAGARAPRMTPGEAQSERLKALRAKDPVLNAAVDALDLELLE
jgi:DNA polymerase-3 subunit gamma/tau